MDQEGLGQALLQAANNIHNKFGQLAFCGNPCGSTLNSRLDGELVGRRGCTCSPIRPIHPYSITFHGTGASHGQAVCF